MDGDVVVVSLACFCALLILLFWLAVTTERTGAHENAIAQLQGTTDALTGTPPNPFRRPAEQELAYRDAYDRVVADRKRRETVSVTPRAERAMSPQESDANGTAFP